MIERLNAHYGFTKTPFGKTLAPGMLHHHTSHNQAVARSAADRATHHRFGRRRVRRRKNRRRPRREDRCPQTRPVTPSFTLPIPPPAHAAFATTLSPALAACHGSKTPPFSPEAADALAAENTERGRQPVGGIQLRSAPSSTTTR